MTVRGLWRRRTTKTLGRGGNEGPGQVVGEPRRRVDRGMLREPGAGAVEDDGGASTRSGWLLLERAVWLFVPGRREVVRAV